MVYYIIRILFALILMTITLFIIHKKSFKKKNLITCITITSFILIEVGLIFLPIENLFITFSSQQVALSYMHSGQMETAVEGNSSALIVYYDHSNSIDSFTILKKSGSGWKLCLDVWNPIFLKFNDERAIRVYKYQNEYYVIVSNYVSDKIEISDSFSSNFQHLDNVSKGEIYVAHIMNPDSNYSVTVDDKVFKISS